MILKILLLLAALYVIFILAPAILMFIKIFYLPKGGEYYTARDRSKPYYKPYLARMDAAETFFRQTAPCKKVTINARDGTELNGFYYGQNSERTAIFVHGYRASPVFCFGPLAKELYDRSFNLLFTVNRGHGDGGGGCTTLGIREQYDVIDWVNRASAQPGTEKLLLCGVSMGCAAVSYASDKQESGKIRAMVLDCGFTCGYDQMVLDCRRRHLPPFLLMPLIRLLARLILKIDIRTPVADSLRHTEIPALFLHGVEDGTVPIEQGRTNFESCASEKEWIAVEGAGHTAAFLAGGETVKNRVLGFIDRYL